MPGTEELLSRLQRLEDGYYGDKEATRRKTFFDTYGERFSNNEGLGLAILNELDARGIDTSAADEAVTQILDQLRTECNEIINSIKLVQQTAIDTAQKVEEINDVVSQATAANPDASIDATPPGAMPLPEDMGGEATADMGSEEPLPEDMGSAEPLPEEAPTDMSGAAPADMGGEEPLPEDMGSAAPEDMGGEEPLPEEVPAGNAISDARMKRIKSAFSNARAKKQGSFKPSAGLLSAAQGGR